MKNEISFSYNWNNKLKNKVFTTIRIENNSRYQIGKTLTVRFDSKDPEKSLFFLAEIVDVKKSLLKDLPTYTCWLDTGYSKEDTIDIIKKMYINKNINLSTQYFYIILLKRIK